MKTSIPIFGICLGHQLLALALKAKTKKMKLGHRGANHPVKNLIKNNVEITSQNHGFENIKENIPIFGICLGHQILALALNAITKKMKLGHRGANHPVKNLLNQKVEITSQNHGFEILKESLPKNVDITHKSLFDNCIEGIKLKNKPVFSVQYHPESNPGPQDSVYLFKQFINEVKKHVKKKRY